MSSVSSPAALPLYISQLLTERQMHVASIATIDATLTRVTAALGSGGAASKPTAAPKATSVTGAKRGRKPGRAKTATAVAAKPAAAAKKPGRKGKSGLTAHEFVLAYVTSAKSPTTQDVNKHWKSSGRLGNADNTLSQLTKLKKLKRSPLPGGVRGSQYAAA